MKNLVLQDIIERRILMIRGEKVMLDRDLAELYGVETRYLNKAVSRNIDRFPDDFMFQMSDQEFKHLMFQNGTSRWGGIDSGDTMLDLGRVLKVLWRPNGYDNATSEP